MISYSGLRFKGLCQGCVDKKMTRADRVTLSYRASLESGAGKSLSGDRGKVDSAPNREQGGGGGGGGWL